MSDTREKESSNGVVFLLDQYTRRVTTHLPYDALSKHCVIITDIRELTDEYYGYNFIFCEPSVPMMVTPEILQQILSLTQVKAFMLCNSKNCGEMFEGIAKVEYVDFRRMDWNLLYAVINSDQAMMESYRDLNAVALEFTSFLNEVPDNIKEPITRMYKSYVNTVIKLREVEKENCEKLAEIDTYKKVYALLHESAAGLREVNRKIENEKNMLTAMLSKSCDVTFSGLYTERPRVLYIKSIGHLPGIDNLLLTLHTVLTSQYRVSCKVVKLVDSSSGISLRYIPNVYVPLAQQYTTSDVLDNNFLVSLGSYTMLFGMLMLNRSGLNTLIVHDCRGDFSEALEDSLIDLKLYELPGDYAVLSEYNNILSSVSSAEYVWDFNVVQKETGTRSAKLANHPTVTSIASRLL